MKDRHSKYPFSLKLINWLCRSELAEEIEGNLLEFKEDQKTSEGRFKKLKYWLQVLQYLRPSTLKRFNNSNRNSMFIFNPIQTIKSLARQGASTFINIAGFTVGLVCVIFLYFYIKSELSVDQFHQDKDQVYRVLRIGTMNEETYDIGVTSAPYAHALGDDYSNNIKAVCRAYKENGLVAFEDQKIYENGLLFADPNFFSFFSFPLVRGNKNEVLSNPNSIVLSEAVAQKYFGNEDPIGKVLTIDTDNEFIVTGIMGKAPASSHLEFDMVMNIELFSGAPFYKNWWSNFMSTYVKIETPAEAEYVSAQFPDFVEKYFGQDNPVGPRMGMRLEPLTDIYFDKDVQYDTVAHGNLTNIYILGIVALAILFIASFNYVNLSIAQSFKRAKEMALRKVLGGEKKRIILQILGESLTVLIFAAALSIGLIFIFKPMLANYFQLEFDMVWQDPNIYLFFSGLLLTSLAVSGLYPALLMASFDPNKVLKDKKLKLGKNAWLRKSLVIAQFIISMVLIASTLIIGKQMSYVKNKDLGFDTGAVVKIEINNVAVRNKLESFKERLEQSPFVTSATLMTGEPGGFHDATIISTMKEGQEEDYRVRIAVADEDYLTTFGIQTVAGRNFSEDLQSERGKTAIINERAMKLMGLTAEEVLSKQFNLRSFGFENLRIVGIAKDYHFTSLKNEIEPLVIVNADARWRCGIKVNGQNLAASMQSVVEIWEEFTKDFPMQYTFLDDSQAQLYETETKQERVFTAFSGISIFLACMGVFGLVAHSTRQRQKEFGIRKILGARMSQIFGIVSKEFIMLLLAATLIAIPLTWYMMEIWLEEFVYHIGLGANWFLFVLSSIIAFLIAFVSIAVRTYKAAAVNPARSIRYE